MEDLEFKLSEPVSVSKGGDREDFDTLILNAPPAKEKKYPIKLRKGFMKASMSMQTDRTITEEQKAKAKEEGGELDGRTIEAMLYASDLDVEKYLENFKQLMFVKGVCKIGDKDSEIYLKDVHWDQINIVDIDRLMGEYIANFFVSSWLPKEIMND